MPKENSKTSSFDRRAFLSLVLVLGATALLYLPSLKFGFVISDDPYQVVHNPLIRSLSWDNLGRIFQNDTQKTYIPLTVLTHAVEYHFFGLNPFIYHLSNLILHLGVTAGIFFFVLRMQLPLRVATLTALLFAIHPMHVESVAWVTERKDVLYALFYILALNMYARYVDTNKKRYFFISLMLGYLSILSKAMALSLPLILLVYDGYKKRKFTPITLLEKVPFLLCVVPIAWITYCLNARIPEINLGEAALTWIWTFVFYIHRFLLPFLLSPFYNLPKPISLLNGHYSAALTVFLAMMASLWIFRRNRLFIFAFLYYLASIFFLLRYDDHVDIHIVADRFMYLPSLGFCILLSVGIIHLYAQSQRWGKMAPLLTIGIVGLIGLFLILKTTSQIRVWADDLVLWDRIAESKPDKFYVLDNRGHALALRGKFKKAIADFTQAIRLNPRDYFGYNNRGSAYDAIGQHFLALQDYEHAIKIKPNETIAYFNRGLLLERLGRIKEAIASYSQAIEKDPNNGNAYDNRGTLYFSTGNITKARSDYDAAIKIDSRDIFALNNRAVVYSKQGEIQKALADMQKVIRLQPRNPDNYFNRGLIYYQNSQWQKALKDFDRALTLKRNHPEARRLREETLKRMR